MESVLVKPAKALAPTNVTGKPVSQTAYFEFSALKFINNLVVFTLRICYSINSCSCNISKAPMI